MTERLNVVVIGACGVGKSSFLNYLLGRHQFAAGRATATTPAFGFFEHPATIRGFDVRLIDSWGLEAGRSTEWRDYLRNELQTRGVAQSIDRWFHGLCYLISAASNRVLAFDLDIIRDLMGDGYSIVVVLTKAGKVSTEDLDAMRSVLASELGDSIPVVAVNSVKETLHGGHVIEPFGLHEFEQELVLHFWETIRQRIPRRIGSLLVVYVKHEWDQNVVNDYLGGLGSLEYAHADRIVAELKRRAEILKNTLLAMSATLPSPKSPPHRISFEHWHSVWT